MARKTNIKTRHNAYLGSVRASERREWLRIAGVPVGTVRHLPKREAGRMLQDLEN